jgi:hypothetical protein
MHKIPSITLPTAELKDRRPKAPLRYPLVYSVKVPKEIKEKIDQINQAKEGLADQVREAIVQIVNMHWERIQEESESA